MSRALLFLFVLLCACSGSSNSSPPAETPKSEAEKARDAKQRELDAIYADKPQLPYVVDRTHAFAASRDCMQGPFRIEGKTLGAKYGEDLEIYACTPRSIAGRSRFVVDGRADDAMAFGGAPENQRCRASETEIARIGDAGASTSSQTTSAAKDAGPAAKATTVESERLTDATFVPGDRVCPEGTQQHILSGHSWETSAGTALRPNLPFHVEIWSSEPNDLRGVVFVIKQSRIDPSVTQEQWTALRAKRDVWWERLAAFEKTHDDMFVREDAGTTLGPPPAARAETEPPKPSVHAEWVPGYYHASGTSWVWIAGWWRVPDEDVKANLTVTAPTAPPPVRDEASERVAARPADAVWAEGHWQWDGARWVWVAGAWRLPPQHDLRWQPPTWRPRGTVFVFVPGGWGRRR